MPKRTEISKEMKNKIYTVGKEMFDQQVGEKDYPFTDVIDQVEELEKGYLEGWLSEDFINFGYEGATR
jgi:hypothetical protein